MCVHSLLTSKRIDRTLQAYDPEMTGILLEDALCDAAVEETTVFDQEEARPYGTQTARNNSLLSQICWKTMQVFFDGVHKTRSRLENQYAEAFYGTKLKVSCTIGTTPDAVRRAFWEGYSPRRLETAIRTLHADAVRVFDERCILHGYADVAMYFQDRLQEGRRRGCVSRFGPGNVECLLQILADNTVKDWWNSCNGDAKDRFRWMPKHVLEKVYEDNIRLCWLGVPTPDALHALIAEWAVPCLLALWMIKYGIVEERECAPIEKWTEDECKRALEQLVRECLLERNVPLDAVIGVDDPSADGGRQMADAVVAMLSEAQHRICSGYVEVKGGRGSGDGQREAKEINVEASPATVLLVDDVAFSGNTLRLAYSALVDHLQERASRKVRIGSAVLGAGRGLLANREAVNLIYHYESKPVVSPSVELPWGVVTSTGSRELAGSD